MGMKLDIWPVLASDTSAPQRCLSFKFNVPTKISLYGASLALHPERLSEWIHTFDRQYFRLLLFSSKWAIVAPGLPTVGMPPGCPLIHLNHEVSITEPALAGALTAFTVQPLPLGSGLLLHLLLLAPVANLPWYCLRSVRRGGWAICDDVLHCDETRLKPNDDRRHVVAPCAVPHCVRSETVLKQLQQRSGYESKLANNG